MTTEAASRADFTQLRYAQVWEDADVLLAGLEVGPGDRCLSIASAGDNALAMLAHDPDAVTAVDLNPAQLAALELRVAAFRSLEHAEILELIGSRQSDRRAALFRRCRGQLGSEARAFWESQDLSNGIGSVGKFERYFSLFRRRAIRLAHSRKTIGELFEPRVRDERAQFYETRWNNRRWRLMFRFFFSRHVMGKLGRDPEFFRYVEGNVADRILQRACHALVELAPDENPYLQWILLGQHRSALPFYLRRENFESIRKNLDRLTWRRTTVEEALQESERFTKFNLSDIFEYMSPTAYETLLGQIADRATSGARIAYWNMLAPRSRPEPLAERLVPLSETAERLHLRDRAFFYSRFILEEVR